MSELGRIGLVAVQREIAPLCEVLQQESREQHGEAILRTGSIDGRPVVLGQVLLGPVNAALGAQALITRYTVTSLISFGSAGALDGKLSRGDLVIARRAIAHDAGVFSGQRFDPSGVVGRDGQGRIGYRRSFEAAPDLVSLALHAAQSRGERVRIGTVVTGNQAIFSTARKHWLRQTFDAMVVDMETAAVAQVAVAYGLPWVGVRAISDSASDALSLDHTRLRLYLDEDRPVWWQRVDRLCYLLTHPVAWRRLRHLQRGFASASERVSWLVEAMLRA